MSICEVGTSSPTKLVPFALLEPRHSALRGTHGGLSSTKTLKRDCRIGALGSSDSQPVRPIRRRGTSGLVTWRLKRAIDHIEANLAGSLSLPSIASVAGLTRMHFAAQFRVATGLRPHEYVLRRRIDRAQRLLINSTLSVVDVALTVGFQNQSHFTSVFKRFVGQPPRAWRQASEALAHDPSLETPARA